VTVRAGHCELIVYHLLEQFVCRVRT